MNCGEGTLTENGSKWSKKRKRRSEVRESELLNEKIKEDISTRKMDCGQLSKRKKPPADAWSTSRERRKDTLAKPEKHRLSGPRFLDTWGFGSRVLTPRHFHVMYK
jgi:hypothetical protein